MTRFKLVSYGSISAFIVFVIFVVSQSNSGNVNSSRDMSTHSKGMEKFTEPKNLKQNVLTRLRDELKQLEARVNKQAHTLDDLRKQSFENGTRLAAIESIENLMLSSQEETQLEQNQSGEQSSELDAEQLEQIEFERANQILSTLDNEMSKEPYDDIWAPEMQETIATTLQNQKFGGSELVTVACKSSLCRIDVEHDNADAESEFLHSFVPTAGYTDTEVFYSRSEGSDGRSEMTYYISRDGLGMPSLGGI